MKTKFIFVLIFLCIVTNIFSQTNLNDYKYVIVPNSFDFLKYEDQYQLNSLTKFLFNKNGFTAIMEDEVFLQDLVDNGCLALRTKVEKLNGLFKTKLVVVLRNCKNEIIFKSKVGESREKDFEKAYHLALRDAFNSFEAIKYYYKPKDNIIAVSNETNAITNQEIEKLKEEKETLKDKKKNKVEAIKKVVEKNNITENEIIEPANEFEIAKTQNKKQSNILYAQVIENGFQVVDSTPKVVMILLTTPKQDVFIVKDKSAIVYKEDGFWYLSENNGSTTTTKTLKIKF